MIVLLAEYIIVTRLLQDKKHKIFFNNAMLDYIVDITSLNSLNSIFFFI